MNFEVSKLMEETSTNENTSKFKVQIRANLPQKSVGISKKPVVTNRLKAAKDH